MNLKQIKLNNALRCFTVMHNLNIIFEYHAYLSASLSATQVQKDNYHVCELTKGVAVHLFHVHGRTPSLFMFPALSLSFPTLNFPAIIIFLEFFSQKKY
jgi:hypothetical protein